MNSTADYQERAVAIVAKSRDIPDFGYHGDLALGETWAFTISRHRDSGLLDNSNFEVIEADLSRRFPDDISVTHASHWAVGWIDHLTVRMLDDLGHVAPAGIAAIEWLDALASYPIANESDYSDRAWKATAENVDEVVSRVARGLDIETRDNWAPDVHTWLYEHDQGEVENADDQGGYPSDESVKAALIALGFYDPRTEVAITALERIAAMVADYQARRAMGIAPEGALSDLLEDIAGETELAA